MPSQLPGTAPEAAAVLRFVTSLVWRRKWLIAAATIAAAALTFILYQAKPVDVWTGKAVLTIGLAPPLDFGLQKGDLALVPIESPRELVMRISSAAFKKNVVTRADFATAAFSQKMVTSSLRAEAGESDRDVEVDLTAGSAADVQAAFRALDAEIAEIHGNLLKRRLEPVHEEISQSKDRIAEIEKSLARWNAQIFDGTTDKTQNRSIIGPPNILALIPAWNELQDRVQRDTNLTELVEPSVLHLDVGAYSLEHRSIGELKASIVAGLVMLFALVVLTIVLSTTARRPSAD